MNNPSLDHPTVSRFTLDSLYLLRSPFIKMGWSMVLGTVVALVAGCYLVQGLIFSKRDAQEPTYIQPSVPLIGHFLDYLKKGTPYFSDIEYELI